MSAVHEGRMVETMRAAFPGTYGYREIRTGDSDRRPREREMAARNRERLIASTKLALRFGPESDIHQMLGLTGHDATPDGLGSRVREANYARRARKAELA